jgi:cytochrome c oxidase subunit 3
MDGSATPDRPGPEEHAAEGGGHADHRSRWPVVAALGAGTLYLGVGLALVGRGLVPTPVPAALIGIGVPALVAGLAGWTNEAFLSGGPSLRDRSGLYTGGMALFLVSDVATFAAGFVYYAFVRAGAWPPAELPALLGSLVVANTALLLASSVTLHYGHRALEAGDRRRFLGLLGATLGLGALFVVGQAVEYYEFVVGEGFGLSAGAFASAFYGLTGLHGLHVALGVVLLAVVTGRALRGAYAPGRDASVRTVSLYWHFVDGVWLFLVVVLYVGASLG